MQHSFSSHVTIHYSLVKKSEDLRKKKKNRLKKTLYIQEIKPLIDKYVQDLYQVLSSLLYVDSLQSLPVGFWFL
jgi:hypothetical protein